MKIPFTKAHGAKNDFLLTWRAEAPNEELPVVARAICDRHTGVGADGWMIVDPPDSPQAEGAIELYNSDGSAPEISGNGTRCAAAFLIQQGYAPGVVRIRTGAGIKILRLLKRRAHSFEFEMNMGRPRIIAEHFELVLSTRKWEVVLLDVGNPQCAVPVVDFEFDWRRVGAEMESHPHFPNRTNVSFFRKIDPHSIDVRFYERGAGETMSSGTGSTGAAAAAVALGMARSPMTVLTPAGPIGIRYEEDLYLTGPAEIVAEGQFYL